MLTTTKKHTYLDYDQLPEGAPYQLIDGELTMSPSPTFYHQKVMLRLAVLIERFVEEQNLGEVVTAPMDVYLSETEVYQPDIIYISNERRHIIHEKIRGVPDLIVEVLSPSNAYYDLVHKKNNYESVGVREYWLIDPQEKIVEVYENREKGFRLFAKAKGSGDVSSKVLHGFSVGLDEIF
jgi:Uma2 family endonuclease